MNLQVIRDLADGAAPLLAEAAWKSTIVLGTACLLTALFRRRSAALRMTIFSAAVIAALVLILALPFTPRLSLPVPERISSGLSPETVASQIADSGSSNLGDSSVPTEYPGYEVLFTIGSRGVATVWVTVTLILVLRLFTSLFALRRLRVASFPVNDPRLHGLLQEALCRLGCGSKRLLVFHSRSIGVPITWGFLRHVIVLPEHFQRLTSASQRSVLTHELSHIERHDFVIRMLAGVLCTILWFQPLSWIVRRRLCEEQERAADDSVLAVGERASSYARVLLECHEHLTVRNPLPIALGMIERRGLKSRLDAILNPSVRRRPVTIRAKVAASSIALGVTLPLAAITLGMASATDEKTEQRPDGRASISLENITSEPAPQTISSIETLIDKPAPTRDRRRGDTDLVAQGADKTVANPSKEVESRGILRTDSLPTMSASEGRRSVVSQDDPVQSYMQAQSQQDSSLTRLKPSRPDPSEMVRQVFENIRNGFANGNARHKDR